MSERNDELELWVIYDRPRDFPGSYVVRRQRVLPGGAIVTDAEFRLARTLETARMYVPPDSVCIGRDSADDPCIAEVWI